MQYKKKEISEKILQAGRQEYAEKGYRAGNISVIAANSGVPVGNLYRYFDGKMGLLNAIVKPAYTQIPKIINELGGYDHDGDVSIEQMALLLTTKLLEVFEKYGSDILILVDKCASTRYEDFFEKLIGQCNDLLLKKLFPEPDENDVLMSQILSKSFMNSIFDILRQGLERSEMEIMINRLLIFYFADIKNRIKGGVHEQR